LIHLPDRIELPGLALRAPRLEDAPALFVWASDPEVTRYLSFTPHRDLEASLSVVRGWTKAWAESGGRLLPCRPLAYLIEVEETAVGSLSVASLRYGYELGYALRRDRWGQGLMPRAVTGLTDVLLRLGAVRVTATAHVENTASHRTL